MPESARGALLPLRRATFVAVELNHAQSFLQICRGVHLKTQRFGKIRSR